MNALPFTAAAVMIMLPGLVSLFKLLGDDQKVPTAKQECCKACRKRDRLRAAAQSLTQTNPQVVIASA